MNNKGITLVELIVYVGLVGIVTVLISSQMKIINTNFISGRRVSGLQSESRDVVAMLAREIRNTGFKTVFDSLGPHDLNRYIISGTYVSDSSSFVHREGNPSDTLTIYKARVTGSGLLAGIDTIQYHLQGDTLKRLHGGDTIDLASNVRALQFQYGVFDDDSTMIIDSPAVYTNWTSLNCTPAAHGSVMEIDVSGATSGDVRHVTPVSFSNAVRIQLDFKLEARNGFPEDLDYVEWAVRSSGGMILTSERFLPHESPNRIILPLPAVSYGRLSLNFQSSGPGELLLHDVTLRRADLGSYVWKDDPPANEKRAVKAIRLCLLTRSDSETGMSVDSSVSIGNVSVTRTGAYTWRQFTETIETPNNGTF
ncbi:MAG: Tfp pilus assembly protein FimT/FimU [Chitinispirillaceae bacterium]